MPFSLSSLALTRLNFAAPLKTFIDGLETSVGTAQSTATSAQARADQSYIKATNGIGIVDLDEAVVVRRYIGAAWEPRGTTRTDVTVLWLKPLAADPDPPINATHFLAGTDVLIKASA